MFTYSIFPYMVMYMTVYAHITKYHKGNACLLRHSSSPRSLHGSFISPRGRRLEYWPRGLINEVQLIFKNSPKRHFFVHKPRGLYTSKYGILPANEEQPFCQIKVVVFYDRFNTMENSYRIYSYISRGIYPRTKYYTDDLSYTWVTLSGKKLYRKKVFFQSPSASWLSSGER